MPESQQKCWRSASGTPTSECQVVSGRSQVAAADHSYLHDSRGGVCSTQVQFGAIHMCTRDIILMSTVSTAALLPRRWIYLSICQGRDLQRCEQGQGPVPSDTQTPATPLTIFSINF